MKPPREFTTERYLRDLRDAAETRAASARTGRTTARDRRTTDPVAGSDPGGPEAPAAADATRSGSPPSLGATGEAESV